MTTDSLLAYLNGDYTTNGQLSVPVFDAGFVQGLTVAEQLRTFGGRLFRLEQHFQRLKRSLDVVGVPLPVRWDELSAIAETLVRTNYPRLQEGDDLGLTIFVTPGSYAALAGDAPSHPMLCLHTQPLAFHQWAAKYATGQALVISAVRQVSSRNWPTELKCRSRMHYHLADREARAAEPGSRALLLDLEGHVSEASTANVFAYYPEIGFMTPRRSKILPGVSLDTLIHLAAEMEIAFLETDLQPGELLNASEVLLCSTSPCLLPVVRIDGRSIGAGVPGPMYRRLLDTWSELVGVSIQDQAERIAAQGSQLSRFRAEGK